MSDGKMEKDTTTVNAKGLIIACAYKMGLIKGMASENYLLYTFDEQSLELFDEIIKSLKGYLGVFPNKELDTLISELTTFAFDYEMGKIRSHEDIPFIDWINILTELIDRSDES